MLLRLRVKIIAMTMGVLVVVFAAVVVTLNVYMRVSSTRQTDAMLEMVASRDGQFFSSRDNAGYYFGGPGGPNIIGGAPREPDGMPGEMQEMRIRQFFFVRLSEDASVLETNVNMMGAIDETQAAAYAGQALSGGREHGSIGNLRYLVRETPYGHIAVFAERGLETQLLGELTRISLIVAGITCGVLLLLSLAFARWAVRPIQVTLDKQRRFISDASHELKTPLTILAANVDVLEGEVGENKRFGQMREQAQRMGALIGSLLSLARAEEGASRRLRTPRPVFDLSAAVLETTLEFESCAFEAGRRLEYRIPPALTLAGDEAGVRQAVGILLDNAVKYADDGGLVHVTLEQIHGRPALTVYNTGAGIPSGEESRIFDRFYRIDDSRARTGQAETGGYGLGLSIAKTAVESMGGRITVSSRPGESVSFTVWL